MTSENFGEGFNKTNNGFNNNNKSNNLNMNNSNGLSTIMLKSKNHTTRRVKIPCDFQSLYKVSLNEFHVDTKTHLILFEYQVSNEWFAFCTTEGFSAFLDILQNRSQFLLWVKIVKIETYQLIEDEVKTSENIGENEKSGPFVYYGSIIRLLHETTNNRLHSHGINYKGGSKQQEATCYWSPDSNDLFIILPDHQNRNNFSNFQNKKVKYGDKIILKHKNTNKFLHSHNIKSSVTSQQEVSCYGGQDTNNDWVIMHKYNNNKIIADGYWKIGDTVNFFHKNTNKVLHSHNIKYKEGSKQQEVTCYHSRDNNDNWKVIEIKSPF